MTVTHILIIFIALRIVQHLIERTLSRVNHKFYSDNQRQMKACNILAIGVDDMRKTYAYSLDKFKFATKTDWLLTFAGLLFLGAGGLGLFEYWAVILANLVGGKSIAVGLFFFGLLGLGSMLINLPFEYYKTFIIEENHGFNRQTRKGFVLDTIKGILLGTILGGLILSLVLWIMESTGQYWWLWAWGAMSTFSILTAWIYPTLLAPLFNKFTPLEEGDLDSEVNTLAEKIGFKTNGIFMMDASKRSTHGNAYFTGLFGKKRIVLFDTLVDSMSVKEVVAVLAHELGHFKLKHIRWRLIRGLLMTGLIFYLLSLSLPLESFYKAFGLHGISNYGALLVFSLWFGVIDFIIQPFVNHVSRRNEFAADAFAKETVGTIENLGTALLKLREKSHLMPISHPAFSSMYHSHPPLIERLEKMEFTAKV